MQNLLICTTSLHSVQSINSNLTFLTLMPAVFSPSECLFLSSVTVAIGLRPAFSARVMGITSKASAKALKQYCSIPVRVLA